MGAADAVEAVSTDLHFLNDGFVIMIAPTSKRSFAFISSMP
jgi:hypothetical protein